MEVLHMRAASLTTLVMALGMLGACRYGYDGFPYVVRCSKNGTYENCTPVAKYYDYLSCLRSLAEYKALQPEFVWTCSQ